MPILETQTEEREEAACRQAADILADGGIVALPSETVYGLAADATKTEAVERVFKAKGRPAHNPLIIHVDSIRMAREFTAQWPESAERLANAFWPGPLTLVLPHNGRISDKVTAGGDTVAVRLPAHPLFRRIIGLLDRPLAAPSANRSNHVSPTMAKHVTASLGEDTVVVDGGPCAVGIESTVLDLTTDPVSILRFGMISGGSIASLLGKCTAAGQTRSGALKSPGQLSRHYAPKAHLMLFDPVTDRSSELAKPTGTMGGVVLLGHQSSGIPQENVPSRLLPGNPADYARCLYAELHECDKHDFGLILVQNPPIGDGWDAIWDRLKRSAHQE